MTAVAGFGTGVSDCDGEGCFPHPDNISPTDIHESSFGFIAISYFKRSQVIMQTFYTPGGFQHVIKKQDNFPQGSTGW